MGEQESVAGLDGKRAGALHEVTDGGFDGGKLGAGEGAEEGDVGGELVEVRWEVAGAEGGDGFMVGRVGVQGQDVGVGFGVGGLGGMVGVAGVGVCGVGA